MAYDRNEYLLAHYGITALCYAEMMAEQGGVCKCCGQLPSGKPLHVDHDHTVASLKIRAKQHAPGIWSAYVAAFDQMFQSTVSLADVKQIAKRWLLAKSVRGLLCWKCNEGLRAFKNRVDVCLAAGKYLADFKAACYPKGPEVSYGTVPVDLPGAGVR